MFTTLLVGLAMAGPWYEGCTMQKSAAQETVDCGMYRANFVDYPDMKPQVLHEQMVQMSTQLANEAMEVVGQEAVELEGAAHATLVTYKQERPDLFALYAVGALPDGARKADCSIRAASKEDAMARCRVVVESLLKDGLPKGLPTAAARPNEATLEAVLGAVTLPDSCEKKGDRHTQQAECAEGLYHAAVVGSAMDPSVAAKAMVETLLSSIPEQMTPFVGPIEQAPCALRGVATTCHTVTVGPPEDPSAMRIIGAPHKTDKGNAMVICLWQG